MRFHRRRRHESALSIHCLREVGEVVIRGKTDRVLYKLVKPAAE